jgi:hypothetical protein
MTIEVLETMSIPQIAQTIEDHNKETALLYEAMAAKNQKRTTGEKPMSDDKVSNAVYWLRIAKEQRKILAIEFDLPGFEESVIIFKCMTDLIEANGNLSVKLKIARENAAKDCLFFCSIVRKAIQEKAKDPVYTLILGKEPNPRKAPTSNGVQAKAKEETETLPTT